MRRIFFFFLIPSLFLFHTPGRGAETPSPASLAQLQRQMLKLQQQMISMQQAHEKEIQALKNEISRLQKQRGHNNAIQPKDEAAALRQAATQEIETEPTAATDAAASSPNFKSGAMSLQALNPELSVVGDMVGLYRDQDETRERSDFSFRTLGLHFRAYLDPYSRFKAAVEMHPEGIELGEAYLTRFGVLPGVNLTVGKFRQPFGVVNRWHQHALDQVDYPLALREIFGEDGLNQTGISLDWAMPPFLKGTQHLTLQLTNGENEQLFGENSLGTPSTLLHYRNYRDLSRNTYCELGLTGLLGWNDEWTLTGGATLHDRLPTLVGGMDFSVLWEPTDRMRYRNVEWRSELYWLNRKLRTPAGARDTINAWGAYSSLQSKISRTWDIGLRLDYYRPAREDYATADLEPLIYAASNAYRWQVGPYMTWHQSPFVKWRCELDHADGKGMDEAENLLLFQLIFAAGPHKHERY